jgi:hypothetical protein
MGRFGIWGYIGGLTVVGVLAALVLGGYWFYLRTDASWPCHWDFADDQNHRGNCSTKCQPGFSGDPVQHTRKKDNPLQQDIEFWCCRPGYHLNIEGVNWNRPLCDRNK